VAVRPYHLSLDDEALHHLRERLRQTRWSTAFDGGWEYGMDPTVLKRWCERWARFDWRAYEQRLQRFPQFVFRTDGVDLHFLHVRSDRADARPLLLMNGWPSNFIELTKVIEPLVQPDPDAPAFHVIVPSLPGFGLSSAPTEKGWNITRIGQAVAALMEELEYDEYFVHAGDMGAGAMLAIAKAHPDRVLGMHSINVYWGYPPPDDLSEAEKEWLEQVQKFPMTEGGYAMIQGTKPQTLEVGLTDSPAGMAAWVLEKWESWSGGGLEAYDPDDLLAMLTVYWVSGNIGPSCRLYFETQRDPEFHALGPIQDTPSGVLILPGDTLPAPRAWGDRWLDVVHWKEAKSGGHFAALEVPELVVKEIRATVRAIDARG
jgi:pimeloyl-ACP methyl ester carboxylesterase